MRSLHISLFVVMISITNIANASIFNEIPVLSKKFLSFFKKSADDILLPTKSAPHLNDSNILPPSGENNLTRPLNDFTPYNLNGAVQLGKCVTVKLKSEPKLSPAEAEQFCKRAFYSCISDHKNSYGFNDSKCLISVNEGKAYSADEITLFRK